MSLSITKHIIASSTLLRVYAQPRAIYRPWCVMTGTLSSETDHRLKPVLNVPTNVPR